MESYDDIEYALRSKPNLRCNGHNLYRFTSREFKCKSTFEQVIVISKRSLYEEYWKVSYCVPMKISFDL